MFRIGKLYPWPWFLLQWKKVTHVMLYCLSKSSTFGKVLFVFRLFHLSSFFYHRYIFLKAWRILNYIKLKLNHHQQHAQASTENCFVHSKLEFGIQFMYNFYLKMEGLLGFMYDINYPKIILLLVLFTEHISIILIHHKIFLISKLNQHISNFIFFFTRCMVGTSPYLRWVSGKTGWPCVQ